jgi:hypothetical protein
MKRKRGAEEEREEAGKEKKNYKKIDGVENCGAKFRVSF